MSLPNLLIVGAAKSGTTSLHNYLNQHPDIFMCNPKEPHFLIINEIGKKRIPIAISQNYDYQELFNKSSKSRYRGESSVMYLLFPEICIPNIYKYLGEDIKIVIMLRNPVERAYSGYHHVKRYNNLEELDFEEALEATEERYQENQLMTPASRYKQLGLYYNQVKMFLEEFNDNVHIIIYDDYKKDPEQVVNRVFNFLKVKHININTEKRYMVGGWQWKNKTIQSILVKKNILKSFLKFIIPFVKVRKKIRDIIWKNNISDIPNMKENTRKSLQKFYKEDIKKLSLLINRDLNHWSK